MSSKSNKTVIGAFVVGAVALLVAGVLVFGSGKFLADIIKVAFYFDHTVKGLNEGSPVVLKGVKIGSVTEIILQYDINNKAFRTEVHAELTKRVAPAGDEESIREMLARRELDIDQFRDEMIKTLHNEGLRAQLGVQSIVTGMLQVELDIHKNAEAAEFMRNPDGYWVIPSMPSDMEKLTSSIQDAPIGEIMEDLRDSLQGIDRLVNSTELGDSIAHLDSSLRGIDELVARMNADYGSIDKQLTELTDAAKSLLTNLDEKYPPLADTIEEALQETRKLVNNVDEQVKPLASNVEATLEDTRKLVNNLDGRVEPLVASFEKTSNSADAVLLQAKKSLELLEGLAPPDSAIAYKLANTLDTLTEAMDNLKSLLAYLQQHPEAILRGKSN